VKSWIDANMGVPLGVVASLFSIGVGVTATGAFWVKGVNDRLARIEDKLGIARTDSASLPEARTKGRQVYGHEAYADILRSDRNLWDLCEPRRFLVLSNFGARISKPRWEFFSQDSSWNLAVYSPIVTPFWNRCILPSGSSWPQFS
jgi:hypothetical protein